MENKKVFGLQFSTQTKAEVLQDVLACIRGGEFESRLVITPNVDHIIALHTNEAYREACGGAWKLTVDGFPVEKFLRLVGVPIPERVTGADLFPDIMFGLSNEIHRPCFIVATEYTANYLKAWLLNRGFAENEFLIAVPPFGFEKSEEFTADYISALKNIHGTHLFMGVGAPKSEIWAFSNRNSLKNVCVLCFGAGIEFFSNNLVRAPVWMQKHGLEWSWRLMSEPKRLAKRYLINSWMFMYYAMREAVRQYR